MEKEFIPYKESLILRELGFSENYLNNYSTPNHPSLQPGILLGIKPSDPLMSYQMDKLGTWYIGAPLYQQAFRWFRKEHSLFFNILSEDPAREDVYWYVYIFLGKLQEEEISRSE